MVWRSGHFNFRWKSIFMIAHRARNTPLTIGSLRLLLKQTTYGFVMWKRNNALSVDLLIGSTRYDCTILLYYNYVLACWFPWVVCQFYVTFVDWCYQTILIITFVFPSVTAADSCVDRKSVTILSGPHHLPTPHLRPNFCRLRNYHSVVIVCFFYSPFPLSVGRAQQIACFATEK